MAFDARRSGIALILMRRVRTISVASWSFAFLACLWLSAMIDKTAMTGFDFLSAWR